MKNKNVFLPRRLVRPVGLPGLALLVLVVLPLSLRQSGAVRNLPVAGPRPAEAASRGGSITGVVRFQDEYPSPEEIEVTQDQEVCGTSKLSQTFVVSPDSRGLKNVLVTVEGVAGGKPPSSPASTATIVQEGCVYKPHVQVMELGDEGAQLIIRNQDGILHNIQASLGKRALFNSAQPGMLKELKKTLTRPGVVRLKCDVHDWMNAYIVLLKDQPYHSVTDEHGQFALDGVPAGSYTLRTWHEALGEMTKTVTVTDGETANVDFVIRPKG